MRVREKEKNNSQSSLTFLRQFHVQKSLTPNIFKINPCYAEKFLPRLKSVVYNDSQ